MCSAHMKVRSLSRRFLWGFKILAASRFLISLTMAKIRSADEGITSTASVYPIFESSGPKTVLD